MFFLLPFYAIRPNAETLLIMQASILGLGAIPIYLFAIRRLSIPYGCAPRLLLPSVPSPPRRELLRLSFSAARRSFRAVHDILRRLSALDLGDLLLHRRDRLS